jgi:glycosyltransferase involved in cell wall biosynthesis
LLKQSGEDNEIIIVDSSDDQMAQKYISIVPSDRVKVIVLDKKTSPAQGRNIGARAAYESYCVLLIVMLF